MQDAEEYRYAPSRHAPSRGEGASASASCPASSAEVQRAAKKALDHGRESDGATPLMLAMELGDAEAVR